MATFGITIRKPISVFIAVLLALMILMSYQVTDESTGRTVLGNMLFLLFSPLQAAGAGAYHGVAGALSRYFDLVGTNQENERLLQEVTELKIKLAATAREKQENERLRDVLKLHQKLPLRLVVGELIGRSAKSPVASVISVNRGSSHGISDQIPVVTPAGIVGMTIETTPLASKIQLITDVSSSVGAMVERTSVAGILVGTGRDFCILRFLPLTTDLKKDDIVVSSGQDGVFPEGLPVGTVTGIVEESELYMSAEVAPFQHSSSLKEVVFLLRGPEPEAVQNP